jgi:gas vesicle protein
MLATLLTPSRVPNNRFHLSDASLLGRQLSVDNREIRRTLELPACDAFETLQQYPQCIRLTLLGDDDMENYDEESEHSEHYGHTIRGFLAGVLVGGLAGAGTMLLMAPQSGQRTRTQIRRKGVALRDQAMDSVEDAMDQARETSQQITANVHKQADKMQQKAEKIQQRGQHALDAQKERWAPVVEASKNAVSES